MDIRAGLDELRKATTQAKITIADEIIDDTKSYIRHLEGELRRGGFIEYPDTEREPDQ